MQFLISPSYSMLNDVPPAMTFNVEEFGAKADGVTDSTASIQNAIKAATNFTRINGRPAEVVMGAGIYRLACPANAQGTPDYCLHISGQGVTFRGQSIAATKIIISNPIMGFLQVHKSDEITVRAFSVDYDPLPFAQGTVKSVSDSSFDITLDSGYSDFSMPVLGDTKYTKDAFGILYDPKSNPPVLKKNVSSWFAIQSSTQISKSPNVWRLQTPNASYSFSPGDRFAYPGRTGVAHAFTFWLSSNLLLKDIQILAGPGAASIWGLNTGKIEIDNFQVKRIPGRLVSTAADAMHMVSNTAKISIRNCLIEGMGDDAINIYTRGSKIGKITSNSQFQFFTEGYDMHAVGHTLQIVDSSNVVRGQAKIKDFQLNNDIHVATVTLDKAIPGLALGDIVYDVEMASPGAIIENNVFNSFRGYFRLRSFGMQFINNTISESPNAQMFVDSDPSYIEGPSLRSANIVVKENNVQGGVIKILGVDTPPPVSNCQITLTACPLNPTHVGAFADEFNGSSSNQAVCIQRATDFYNWCGIKSGSADTSKAEYFANGQLQKSVTIGGIPVPAPTPAPDPTPSSSCQITLIACPLNPTTVGIFADNYNGASTNQTVCMQRATDFYNWCGIKSGGGQTAKADYLLNGQVHKSVTVGALITPAPVPSSSCRITLATCPLYPSVAGIFSDDYNGANSNQTVCMQRATDFYNWCGIKPESGQTSKADYLLNGQVQKTVTVGALTPVPAPTPVPSTSCNITIATCPLHPTTVGTFADNYNGASSNQSACMQRATDFYNWCGLKAGSGQSSKADYLLNGQIQKSVTVSK